MPKFKTKAEEQKWLRDRQDELANGCKVPDATRREWLARVIDGGLRKRSYA